MEHILGFEIPVYAPCSINTEGALIPSVLNDHDLVLGLSLLPHGMEIDPLIQCEDALLLGEAINLGHRYSMETDCIHDGVVERLNDKLEFYRACRALNIPVNAGLHCVSFQEIVRALQTQFSMGLNPLIVKATRSAGGLRNLIVPRDDFIADPEAWGEQTGVAAWGEPVLVEPVLKAKDHFSVMGVVHPNGMVQIENRALRHVENFESMGATVPVMGIPHTVVNLAVKQAKLFATRVLMARGYRGPFDIDVTHHIDGNGSTLTMWETNARHFATEVQLQIGRHLELPVTRSNESVLVPSSATLNDVCSWAAQVERNNKKTRVVITLPPREGKQTIGICVCGIGHISVQKAHDEMVERCRKSLSIQQQS